MDDNEIDTPLEVLVLSQWPIDDRRDTASAFDPSGMAIARIRHTVASTLCIYHGLKRRWLIPRTRSHERRTVSFSTGRCSWYVHGISSFGVCHADVVEDLTLGDD